MNRVTGISHTLTAQETGTPALTASAARMSAKRKSLPTKISQTRTSQESIASSCNDKTARDMLLSPEPVAASDMEFEEEEEDDETEFHSEADDDDDRPAATGSHQKVRYHFLVPVFVVFLFSLIIAALESKSLLSPNFSLPSSYFVLFLQKYLCHVICALPLLLS